MTCVAAVHWSCVTASSKNDMPSPPALEGTAEFGYTNCANSSAGVPVSKCCRLAAGPPFSELSSLSSVFRLPRFGRVSGWSALNARSSSIGTPSRMRSVPGLEVSGSAGGMFW